MNPERELNELIQEEGIALYLRCEDAEAKCLLLGLENETLRDHIATLEGRVSFTGKPLRESRESRRLKCERLMCLGTIAVLVACLVWRGL